MYANVCERSWGAKMKESRGRVGVGITNRDVSITQSLTALDLSCGIYIVLNIIVSNTHQYTYQLSDFIPHELESTLAALSLGILMIMCYFCISSVPLTCLIVFHQVP